MNNLFDLINNITEDSCITIDTLTDVKLTGGKKNICQGRVTKYITNCTVIPNINTYEKMIKQRLISENKDPSDFQLSSRSWGTRVDNTPFIKHKDQYYMEVIILNPGNTQILLDSIEVDKSTIEGYPSTREEGNQGNIDDNVIIRSFNVNSIKSITINDQQYSDIYFKI